MQARIDVDADVVRTSPPESVGAVYFCAVDVFERALDGTPVVVHVRGDATALEFEIDADGDLDRNAAPRTIASKRWAAR